VSDCAKVNIACRIAAARARLLLRDYRRDIACKRAFEVHRCQLRMLLIPRRQMVKVFQRIGSL